MGSTVSFEERILLLKEQLYFCPLRCKFCFLELISCRTEAKLKMVELLLLKVHRFTVNKKIQQSFYFESTRYYLETG